MLFSPGRELFLGYTEWGLGLGLGVGGWGLQSGAASAAEIAPPCGCGREQLAMGPQPKILYDYPYRSAQGPLATAQ